MNYHNITKDDMLNGDGIRVVLWVAGCGHHCPGCQNPETWDPDGGIPFDDAAMAELMEELSKDYVTGLTLSGGDPLYPGNRKTVRDILQAVKKRFPKKNIWIYTGYTWDQLMQIIGTNRDFSWVIPEILPYTDVLVDGRYEQDRRDVSLPWRGSSNQRLIDVSRLLGKENETAQTSEKGA